MKLDINLMVSHRLNRSQVVLIASLISIALIITLALILPIKYKNRLIEEADKVTQELVSTNRVNKEYVELEKQFTILLKRVEIYEEAEARQRDVYRILEMVNRSISSEIELTHISISGNIMNIQGIAPNDRIIADSILKLQENQGITAVHIQEISLDREKTTRKFHLQCLTQLKDSYMEDILLKEGESVEDFN